MLPQVFHYFVIAARGVNDNLPALGPQQDQGLTHIGARHSQNAWTLVAVIFSDDAVEVHGDRSSRVIVVRCHLPTPFREQGEGAIALPDWRKSAAPQLPDPVDLSLALCKIGVH